MTNVTCFAFCAPTYNPLGRKQACCSNLSDGRWSEIL